MGRPRRAAGWGSIRIEQRGELWYADGRYRDGAGKDQRHRAHGPTPEAAELRLRAKVGHDDGHAISATSSVAQLADFWLRERARDVELRRADPAGRAGLAAQSLDRYRSDLRTLVLPTIGETLLGELTSPSLDAFLRGMARSSVPKERRARGLLKQLLDEAVRVGALDRSPLVAPRQVRRPAPSPVAYSAEQIAAIRRAWMCWIAEYDKPGIKPTAAVLEALLVSAATSMRIGEVLALRACDVRLDPTPPSVSVTGTLVQTKGGHLHRQPHTKDPRQARTIRLPEVAAAILRRRKEASSHAESPLWPARGELHSSGSHDSSPWISQANLRRVVRSFRIARARDLRAAGVDPSRFSPKTMRSTAATAVAQGLSLERAAELAGHRDVAVTSKYYIARTGLIDAGHAEILDSLLGGLNDLGS